MEGIFIDYLQLIESKLGTHFNRKYYSDWSQLVQDTKDGKTDLILEVQQTPLKKNFLNVYAEAFQAPLVILANKKHKDNLTLKDFDGKVIAVPASYAWTDYLIEHHSYIELSIYQKDAQCVQAVEDGICDAYFGPITVIGDLIRKFNFKNVKIVGHSDRFYAPGIGVVKNNLVLNRIIKKVINSISYKEKKEIKNNWLFSENKPFYKKNNFWFTFWGILTTTLVFTLGTTFFLKFTIKKRTFSIQKAKDNAEKNNDLKTIFLNNISHEIRSPMNGIAGFSSLIKDFKSSHSEKTKYANKIVQSTTSLMQTIEDILEVSKLQTGQTTIHLEKTNINNLLKEVIAELNSTKNVKKNQISATNTLGEIDSKIITDINRFSDILFRLIKKTTDISSNCQIIVQKDNQKLLIFIKSEELPIPNTEDVFENLTNTQKEITNNKFERGLALNIVQKNILLLKGELYKYTNSQGNIFKISLPYKNKKQ